MLWGFRGQVGKMWRVPFESDRRTGRRGRCQVLWNLGCKNGGGRRLRRRRRRWSGWRRWWKRGCRRRRWWRRWRIGYAHQHGSRRLRPCCVEAEPPLLVAVPPEVSDICILPGNAAQFDSPSFRDHDGRGPIIQQDLCALTPWLDEDLRSKTRPKVRKNCVCEETAHGIRFWRWRQRCCWRRSAHIAGPVRHVVDP